MSKDYSNLEGLISNVKESIRNSYDKGYKQGVNDGSLDVKMRVDGVYEKGLNDAWEYAKKIACDKSQNGYSLYTLKEIFGTASISDIFSNFSPAEAIAKLREYEEKQKQADSEIKVGDEVGNAEEKYIITKILSHHYANVMATDGGVAYIDPTRYKKTGRTFPQIAEVVEQLKEEQDEDNTSAG